jgi:DNA-binding Lrp family transcriptional regulator
MDRLSSKILCELDANCRMPLTQMAKKLRIGRNVLDYRIKKLEKEKIITNYICSVSMNKLGYKNYKIYCKMKSMKTNREKEFVSFVKNEKRVIHFIKTEGSFDYAFVVAAKTIQELDSFLTEFKTNFNDILNDYILSIIVSYRIFKLNKLLLGENKESIKFDNKKDDNKEIELDEKDKKILQILSQKANITVVELSEKTGYSIEVVKYRIKNLSQNIVNSFRAIIDMNKLGYFHYVFMLKIRNAKKEDEENLISWCANKLNSMYITKRLGSFDYEFNFAIKDINELNSLLSELKYKFGNIIEQHELIISSELIKLNYLPL